ncbi:3-carboxy-cis,cis-muconate cycloisomerase [Gordonia amarae]|uniref:3-carboxy-cis,cis-muconate cycloisomerase n=2 Tax=Gordonia amarae TaxID=36821 RepID=G7GS42_9ACTN|nr:3-carboxy-cis,cis-muconate cycloisomerase [Gordonia amarae]MCS3877868.1 3-carboxy-cis,cis-muconate cycloisomerase [Gordonia amarae]QHN16590.1 3-carboxy-cis,cis-muconate cycloisomerase [Gordonia amarae]QHN21115.1 3-carboxy-cis,cis-muconate cycloisomerase [Gordonia amarae]QHN29968.1 3-carboxy-cis,cis-muconate cycloisomerase [Gordonia amarae]QHN38743.1 3-carboxy-cis,cis-muconate cycloisomerase [Gordonia amarae]
MSGTRGELFDPIFGASGAAAVLDDASWVDALLTVEAALARAQAAVGVIPQGSATRIDTVITVLREAGDPRLTPAALGAAAMAGGNPVIPLVGVLRSALAALHPDVPPAHVHRGATSQDILDTALVLLLRRAGTLLVTDLTRAERACADLARTHRDTPMVARTLGQQALPTTFGAVAASWLSGLRRTRAEVSRQVSALPVQFGGAAGTLAALAPHGFDVADALADELGLPRALVPWHTDRTPLGLLAGAVGAAAGEIGKIAGDVVWLAATEIGEVTEAASGGSSAMPHKQNPVAAITARAGARRVPALVASVLASMEQEHQRAAGPWHAEWEPLTDLLRTAAGAAARLADSLIDLRVHPDAMARNLQVTHGALLAERVAVALAEHTPDARARVTAVCAAGLDLADAEAITEFLPEATVRELLDPAGYLGHAGGIVDRVLSAPDPDDL